eukprot:3351906-Prymnesium_polylepis.1
MRVQRAVESKARRTADAERLAEENRLYYDRLERAVAKVDDNLMGSLELWRPQLKWGEVKDANRLGH